MRKRVPEGRKVASSNSGRSEGRPQPSEVMGAVSTEEVRQSLKTELGREGEILPDYLISAFIHAAPPQLTEETIRLFAKYLVHRRHRLAVPKAGIALTSNELGASQLGVQLSERWTAEGGDLGELAKLFTMIAYRNEAVSAWASSDAHLDPAELETFWAASGHDLVELSTFLKDVDLDVVDSIPK